MHIWLRVLTADRIRVDHANVVRLDRLRIGSPYKVPCNGKAYPG
jgi:hypothetical protein